MADLPDILILIATADEFKYIRDLLPSPVNLPTQDSKYRVQFELPCPGSNRPYRVTLILLADQGEIIASTEVLNSLYSYPRPPLALVSIGISMGLGKDVRLGDVILADRVVRFAERGRIEDVLPHRKNYHLKLRSVYEVILPESAARMKLCEIEQPDACRRWQESCAEDAFAIFGSRAFEQLQKSKLISKTTKLHPGPILSGPFLVDSKSFKKMLVSQPPGSFCHALDMESGGIAAAGSLIIKEKRPTHTAIIRGASDFGDGTKSHTDGTTGKSKAKSVIQVEDDAYRKLAMRNAFRFFQRLCDFSWFGPPQQDI